MPYKAMFPIGGRITRFVPSVRPSCVTRFSDWVSRSSLDKNFRGPLTHMVGIYATKIRYESRKSRKLWFPANIGACTHPAPGPTLELERSMRGMGLGRVFPATEFIISKWRVLVFVCSVSAISSKT